MGWTSIEWRLKAAKVRLWERAKSPEAGRDPNHIARSRMSQVETGETKGLAAEARDIMIEMGQEAEWRNTEDLGTEGRKTEIRRWQGRQT